MFLRKILFLYLNSLDASVNKSYIYNRSRSSVNVSPEFVKIEPIKVNLVISQIEIKLEVRDGCDKFYRLMYLKIAYERF